MFQTVNFNLRKNFLNNAQGNVYYYDMIIGASKKYIKFLAILHIFIMDSKCFCETSFNCNQINSDFG